MVLELGAFGVGAVRLRWRRKLACEPNSVTDADAKSNTDADADADKRVARHFPWGDRVHELRHFGLRKSEQHLE
jgi:hypothetical protein